METIVAQHSFGCEKASEDVARLQQRINRDKSKQTAEGRRKTRQEDRELVKRGARVSWINDFAN